MKTKVKTYKSMREFRAAEGWFKLRGWTVKSITTSQKRPNLLVMILFFPLSLLMKKEEIVVIYTK